MTPNPNTAARKWAATAPAAAVTGVVERLPEWETLDADRFPDAVNMAKLLQSSGLAYGMNKLAEAMRDGWPADPELCALAVETLDVIGKCPVTEDGLSALAVVHRVSPLHVDAANTRDDPIMPRAPSHGATVRPALREGVHARRARLATWRGSALFPRVRTGPRRRTRHPGATACAFTILAEANRTHADAAHPWRLGFSWKACLRSLAMPATRTGLQCYPPNVSAIGWPASTPIRKATGPPNTGHESKAP